VSPDKPVMLNNSLNSTQHSEMQLPVNTSILLSVPQVSFEQSEVGKRFGLKSTGGWRNTVPLHLINFKRWQQWQTNLEYLITTTTTTVYVQDLEYLMTLSITVDIRPDDTI